MNDLIDRKEALKALREIFTRGNGLRPATVDMINAIKFLPSAEPKKGKWIKKPDPYGFFDEIPVCSECGCTTKMREEYKYCPQCGVEMEVTK